MQEREIKLTFVQGDMGQSTNTKKTLSFGYIKDDIKESEVIDLGNSILNSNCYDFVDFVGASIVETATSKIDIS